MKKKKKEKKKKKKRKKERKKKNWKNNNNKTARAQHLDDPSHRPQWTPARHLTTNETAAEDTYPEHPATRQSAQPETRHCSLSSPANRARRQRWCLCQWIFSALPFLSLTVPDQRFRGLCGFFGPFRISIS